MFEAQWALVIEDDAHSLMAIGTILKELDISYKRNTTGIDVVQKALAMSPRPDFILLDMSLPHGNPFHIVQAIKDSPYLHDIPVIAIADDDYMNLYPQARKAGFGGFFAKPLPRRQFGELLGRIFSGEFICQVPV